MLIVQNEKIVYRKHDGSIQLFCLFHKMFLHALLS